MHFDVPVWLHSRLLLGIISDFSRNAFQNIFFLLFCNSYYFNSEGNWSAIGHLTINAGASEKKGTSQEELSSLDHKT